MMYNFGLGDNFRNPGGDDGMMGFETGLDQVMLKLVDSLNWVLD